MRVLIVEDDPGIGELLVDDLTDEGYAVDWARHGDEALSLLASFAFDLVVLDVMLPGRDGFAITRELRSPQKPRAHPHAHGARPRRRPHRGPGIWCGRLPRQTFQFRRTARSSAGTAAPRQRRNREHGRGRAVDAAPRDAARPLAKARSARFRGASTRCSSTWRSTPGATTAAKRFWSTCGPATAASTRAPSTPIFVFCAANSPMMPS